MNQQKPQVNTFRQAACCKCLQAASRPASCCGPIVIRRFECHRGGPIVVSGASRRPLATYRRMEGRLLLPSSILEFASCQCCRATGLSVILRDMAALRPGRRKVQMIFRRPEAKAARTAKKWREAAATGCPMMPEHLNSRQASSAGIGRTNIFICCFEPIGRAAVLCTSR
jgi:hypothetical protein